MKNLLDQELIEKGSFKPRETEFPPNEAVKVVMRILEQTLANTDVEVHQSFDPDFDKSFLCDVGRIQQVMLNLMTNARNRVPKVNGFIDIRTTRLEKAGEQLLRIGVTDNGPYCSEGEPAGECKPVLCEPAG